MLIDINVLFNANPLFLTSDHVSKQLVPLTDHKHDIFKRLFVLIYLLIRNVNQVKQLN